MFWKHSCVSTGVVALGDMGDKTQLLAVLLAARFKKPVPIMMGILLATLANHALAGAVGGWIAAALGSGCAALGDWPVFHRRWPCGCWCPTSSTKNLAFKEVATWGVFGTTVLAFFLAEMGDKTQIATVALAARYGDLVRRGGGQHPRHDAGQCACGVSWATRWPSRVPMAWVHGVSAALFVTLGVATLLNLGRLF